MTQPPYGQYPGSDDNSANQYPGYSDPSGYGAPQ